MLENPKVNKDLIYDYRGIKLKHLTTHLVGISLCGWQNNRKIGPILAINNKEFKDLYVAEKFN